jgi:hypothetical protein
LSNVRQGKKKRTNILNIESGSAKPVSLNLAATENFVLFAARAFRATQAARQQHRNPCGHYQGHEASARRKPLN